MRTAASTLGDSFTGDYGRIADIEHAPTALDGGWLVLDCDWDAVHIVPVLDSVVHCVEVGDECVCGPALEVAGCGFLVTHHSLDGREQHEH